MYEAVATQHNRNGPPGLCCIRGGYGRLAARPNTEKQRKLRQKNFVYIRPTGYLCLKCFSYMHSEVVPVKRHSLQVLRMIGLRGEEATGEWRQLRHGNFIVWTRYLILLGRLNQGG
jgi:hypothetical protein